MGAGFRRVLCAAQAGDEAAFVRLWRDANPVMTRYLRVAGLDDPYDAACEGWITVLRGLPGFHGDETAWRVWVLACARVRAEESSLRRSWGSVTVLPGVGPGADAEPLELEDLETTRDVEHRGVAEAITAIRALPLGQGEIVMLRLCAELPVAAVADIVGTDATAVRRSEERALERLRVDRDLLRWSLTAPATPAELADERVALGAFRSLPRTGTPGSARVIALGPTLARPQRARVAAGWSRSALVGVAAVSASVVSLGGLGAAAYTGSLPAPVQRVMHDVFGAPAPEAGPANGPAERGKTVPGSSGRADPSSVPGAATGPHRGSPARQSPHPTKTANPRSTESGKPSSTRTANSRSTQSGKPTSTRTANQRTTQTGKPSSTRTVNSRSTQIGRPSTTGTAKANDTGASNPRTTETGSPTTRHTGTAQRR